MSNQTYQDTEMWRISGIQACLSDSHTTILQLAPDCTRISPSSFENEVGRLVGLYGGILPRFTFLTSGGSI
jgi:hypothetical protein